MYSREDKSSLSSLVCSVMLLVECMFSYLDARLGLGPRRAELTDLVKTIKEKRHVD
jgi:hypothetical protein